MALNTLLNGPGGMYKLRPFFDRSLPVELPTCMYKLRSYYESDNGDNKGNENVDPTLLELEQRQESILRRLEQLKSEVTELTQKSGQSSPLSCGDGPKILHQSSPVVENGLCDIVVNADPGSPPFSVLVLRDMLSQQYKVLSACHMHSSAGNVPDALRKISENNGSVLDRTHYQFVLTLIWKKVENGPVLMVKPNEQTAIHGEANIARYLARLLHPAYDESDPITATEMDVLLDLSTQLHRGNAKEKAAVLRTLNAKLGKSAYLLGSTPGLADIVLWSVVHQTKLAGSAPGNVAKWLDGCSQQPIFKNALSWL